MFCSLYTKMEMSKIAILFLWIVNREKLHILIIISFLPSRLISCLLGHYEDLNGNCIECPPGSRGRNCSITCRNGTYGLGCRYTCTCMDCDPVTGCHTQDTRTWVLETMSVTSTDDTPAEGPEHTVISHLLLIVLLIVILTIIGCNFAATMVVLLRFSTKLHLSQHQEKTPKESTTQGTIEEIEMNPDGYESPIITTERQEMRVYTELH